MTTITTRSGKGSPLTNNEVDANFTNLNTDKAELSGADFTGDISVAGDISLGNTDHIQWASTSARIEGNTSGADYVKFYTNSTENLSITGSAGGAVVVNEGSSNLDFRVESTNNANMLFVDAGNDRVGVGGAPSSPFHVQSGTTNNVATFTSTDSTAVIMMQDNAGNAQFGVSGSTARIAPSSSYAVLEASQSAVVLNNAAQDTDFRVESDSNANMLFVDAGLNRVGLLTNTPSDTLDVRSGGIRLYDNTDGNGGVISFGSSAGYQTLGGGSGSDNMNYRTYGSHVFKTTTGPSSTTDGTERMSIGTGVVINETGADADFRVESNSNTQALLVDAGGNFVAMGNTVKNPVSGFSDQHGFGIDVTNGNTQLASDSLPLELGRTSTAGANGMFIQMRAGSTAVGALRNVDSDLVIHTTTANHGGLRFGLGYVGPTNNAGTVVDDSIQLGLDTVRFTSICLSQGVQFGNTGAAAELLDDYEEGTWTPALWQGTHTYTSQVGRYVKIGKMVTVWGAMNISSRGSSSSELGISGLPFASSGGASAYASTLGIHSAYGSSPLLPTGVDPTGVSVESTSGYFRSTHSTNASYNINQLNSSGEVTFAFTYEAT